MRKISRPAGRNAMGLLSAVFKAAHPKAARQFQTLAPHVSAIVIKPTPIASKGAWDGLANEALLAHPGGYT